MYYRSLKFYMSRNILVYIDSEAKCDGEKMIRIKAFSNRNYLYIYTYTSIWLYIYIFFEFRPGTFSGEDTIFWWVSDIVKLWHIIYICLKIPNLSLYIGIYFFAKKFDYELYLWKLYCKRINSYKECFFLLNLRHWEQKYIYFTIVKAFLFIYLKW